MDKQGITYTMAYGLDAEAVSQSTGGFYDEEKKFLQPINLLVRPDRTIEMGVYATGPLGRFVAQDILKVVRFYRSQKKS